MAEPEAGRDGKPDAAEARSDRAREVERRLEEAYGPGRKTVRDPLDELVLTVLSQNTTDVNRDRAWERLRGEFDGWEEVQGAPRERLEEAIRVAGLASQKAATISRILDQAHEDSGRTSLDFLREMEDAEALRYLRSIKGVGLKTAACVLAFSLRRPVCPVDTHVRRVAERLGLVPEGSTRNAAHRALNGEADGPGVPDDIRLSLHLHLIAHGRAVCTARSPDCPSCSLEESCPKIGVER